MLAVHCRGVLQAATDQEEVDIPRNEVQSKQNVLFTEKELKQHRLFESLQGTGADPSLDVQFHDDEFQVNGRFPVAHQGQSFVLSTGESANEASAKSILKDNKGRTTHLGFKKGYGSQKSSQGGNIGHGGRSGNTACPGAAGARGPTAASTGCSAARGPTEASIRQTPTVGAAGSLRSGAARVTAQCASRSSAKSGSIPKVGAVHRLVAGKCPTFCSNSECRPIFPCLQNYP